MTIELKIKNKHLSAEAKIIRKEENKLKEAIARSTDAEKRSKISQTRDSLHAHRTYDLRNEQRATFLARAYLDGKRYSTVERSCKQTTTRDVYILPRVLKMIKKYGQGMVDNSDIRQWFET